MMVITALVLIFSRDSGEAFGGISQFNKLVVATFISILGVCLLVYANPKARLKAGLFALLMAAGVISIPFFVKGEDLPGKAGFEPMADGTAPLFPKEEEPDPLDDLKTRFGLDPLESEQTRLEEKGGRAKAYGIYLTNLVRRNMYTARDYLIREAEAGPSSHPYPRDDGNYLMLLTEVTTDFASLANIAANLGSVEETHPELGVIVVKVENDQFVAGSAEKLNNSEDPAFYELNMRELESIDLDRVERAVERLAMAPPKIYRTDISRMLVALMMKPGVRFHGEIARALITWAEEPGQAGKAALSVVKRYTAEGSPVPETLVELVVKENTEGAIPAIHSLWVSNPNLWQSRYMKFGSRIEDPVVGELGAEDANLRRSALALLEEIGTAKSIPALRRLMESEDPGIRVLAERAVAGINRR